MVKNSILLVLRIRFEIWNVCRASILFTLVYYSNTFHDFMFFSSHDSQPPFKYLWSEISFPSRLNFSWQHDYKTSLHLKSDREELNCWFFMNLPFYIAFSIQQKSWQVTSYVLVNSENSEIFTVKNSSSVVHTRTRFEMHANHLHCIMFKFVYYSNTFQDFVLFSSHDSQPPFKCPWSEISFPSCLNGVEYFMPTQLQV